MIIFENLTTEGYAAFALALIFTILSMAGFIVFARHKDLNKVLTIVISLVLPFLAIFCWTYLILNIIKYGTLISLEIALGTAAGYVVVALCLAFIINALLNGKKEPKEKKEKKEEEAAAPENTQAAPVKEEEKEEVEEKVVVKEGKQTKPRLITVKEKLMLNHTPEAEAAQPVEEPVENEVVESETQEETVEEQSPVEENNEVIEEAPAEPVEPVEPAEEVEEEPAEPVEEVEEDLNNKSVEDLEDDIRNSLFDDDDEQ